MLTCWEFGNPGLVTGRKGSSEYCGIASQYDPPELAGTAAITCDEVTLGITLVMIGTSYVFVDSGWGEGDTVVGTFDSITSRANSGEISLAKDRKPTRVGLSFSPLDLSLSKSDLS